MRTARSIVGKNYRQSYWVGVCGSGSTVELRSYINGESSIFTSGIVIGGPWVHVAVTSDGSTRSHYIDGELVGTQPETGPPATSTAALEISGDASWPYSINGNINEVRLWNVARTEAEIRSTINVPVRTAQPGLVAVWPMFTPDDAVGSLNWHVRRRHPAGPQDRLPSPATRPRTAASSSACRDTISSRPRSVSARRRTPSTPATIVDAAQPRLGHFSGSSIRT